MATGEFPQVFVDEFRNGDVHAYTPETVVRKDSCVVCLFDDGTKLSVPWERVVKVKEEYGDA